MHLPLNARQRAGRDVFCHALPVMIFLLLSVCVTAQKFSYTAKGEPVSQIFREIEKQTKFSIFFSYPDIQGIPKVTAVFRNVSLEKALAQLLKDQPLDFTIEGNTVFIRKKKEKPLPHSDSSSLPLKVIGTVTGPNNQPLAGATVRLKGKSSSVVSDERGNFELAAASGSTLVISYVGFQEREIRVLHDGPVRIGLLPQDRQMDTAEVVVNTGYQKLPKERSTGSFTYISNQLLNRSVSTDVLSRLDGVASGVIFNREANKVGYAREGGDPGISIRGRSTIFSNTEPLIVLDNIPYDGDPANINPNDIESVTILKDAAAASIWGVRAGNGVIVLTSKKGKYDQKPVVALHSNVTVMGKPDLYAIPQLSAADYIGLEKFWFDKGKYDIFLNYVPYFLQSPVVDILYKERKGTLGHAEAASQLNTLSQQDTRRDYARYFLRNAVNQQYALQISGGGQQHQYYLSGGYDRNANSTVANDYSRYTLNARNTWQLLNQRLELNGDLFFSKSLTLAAPGYSPAYPYEKYVDDKGQALPVVRDFRQASKDALSNPPYLDWNYYPYNERLIQNNRTDLTDYRLHAGLSYKLIPGVLSAGVNYQYQQGNSGQNILNDQRIYSTRLLINEFMQIDPTGNVTYPVPLGGILTNKASDYTSKTLRGQLNYQQTFSGKHQLSAIGGMERKDYSSFNRDIMLYGYNEANATNVPVDYFTYFTLKPNGGSDRIPNLYGQNGTADRFFSYYVNAAYSYAARYTLSVSARRDESNLFGVNANQKGIPLYSGGISWEISKEKFYTPAFLPYLRLRITDGYNGNLNKNLSAYTTSKSNGTNFYGALQEVLVNPPNPDLSWERVHIFNSGLDFGSRGSRFTGSIDWFVKNGQNLIGNSPLAPQTGNTQFTGNTANMQTRGIDLILNSVNMQGAFTWTTNFLFSYVKDKITAYKLPAGVVNNYIQNNYMNPIVGKPYSALFAYHWKGLDSAGNPQGMLGGKLSEDYGSILNSTDLTELVYKGTASPTVFGSVRNNLSWKGLELSFNIVYRLGYYFRRASFNSDNTGYQQADYTRRWQHPGDELHTYVPALQYPVDGQREIFYKGAEVLIEKGDQIRLQDVRLSWSFLRKTRSFPFSSLQIYGYASNLGILWRANKLGLDPDNVGNLRYLIPAPRVFSIGVDATF